MNYKGLTFLLDLLMDGEKTSSELAGGRKESLSTISRAVSELSRLGLVQPHPLRKKYWKADYSNELNQALEKLLLVSRHDPQIIGFLTSPSMIKVGGAFANMSAPLDFAHGIQCIGVSRPTLQRFFARATAAKLLLRNSRKPYNFRMAPNFRAKLFFKVASLIRKIHEKKAHAPKTVKNLIIEMQQEDSVLIMLQYGSSLRPGKKARDTDLLVVTRDRFSRGEILSHFQHDKLDLNVFSKRGFLELIEARPEFIHSIATGKVLKGKGILQEMLL